MARHVRVLQVVSVLLGVWPVLAAMITNERTGAVIAVLIATAVLIRASRGRPIAPPPPGAAIDRPLVLIIHTVGVAATAICSLGAALAAALLGLLLMP